jgi:hypothetical protein
MPNLAIFVLPFRHDAMGSEPMLEHVLASLNRHAARSVYSLAGCGVGEGEDHAQDEEVQKVVRRDVDCKPAPFVSITEFNETSCRFSKSDSN